MKVSNNTLGAWALLPESVTLLAHPPTLFCSRGFLISNWLGVPSSKKFCKNFELIQEGEMDAIVNITLEEESCSNVIMEMNKPVS